MTTISIIITSFKEPKTIGKAIESFTNQNIKDSEIIVLAPDEETLAVARKYKVKIIKDPGKGKPAALNLAFKKAKGKYLILSDGDVYVSNNSVKALLERLKDEWVGAVTGRPVPQEKINNKYGYWAHFLLNAANNERIKNCLENKFILLSGYLFAMRNFNLNIPEDVLDDAFISQSIWKKGYKIDYEPKAEVFIKNPSNLKDWLKQKRRNVSSDVKIKQYFDGIQTSRSFKKELSSFYKVFTFVKSFKEFFYSLELLLARLLIWWLGFWDTKIVKKDFNKIWVRIDSTK